ncbi:MAG: oligosaccharide flippase family protein [Rhizobiaceae bacterium]|nr:oligosaccharide flippase family protein [Rhizobiaceae bacterium]
MERLLGYASAYAAAAVLQKGAGFALFIWLAAALTVEEYARFGLFFAFQTGIAALLGAGIVEPVVGMLKEHQEGVGRQRLLAAGFGVFTIVASIVFLAIAAFSVPLSLEINSDIPGLFILFIVGMLSAFFILQAHLIRLDERHVASLMLNNIPMFMAFFLGFVAFVAFGSVESLFGGMAIGLGVSFVAMFGLRLNPRFVFSSPEISRKILVRMPPYVAIAIAAWLTGYGSTYLINALFTAGDVSRFTFAYTLSSVLQLVATSLNQVWSPRFYRIVHEKPHMEVAKESDSFFLWQGFIIGLVGFAVLLVFPTAIELAGDRLEAYRGLSLGLGLLLGAYAVSIPWYHAQNYFFAHSRGPDLMTLVLTSSIIGIALWLLAIWYLGPIGAFLGFALQMIVRGILIEIRAHRLWRTRVPWRGMALALVFIAAGVVAGPLLQTWLVPILTGS